VQLGLSGEISKKDRWAIDPEVLLAITLRLGGRDPRLFDEVLDWVCLNGRLVSVQRLKNLTRHDEASRVLAEAALAWAGAHNPVLHGWYERRRVQQSLHTISPGSIRVRIPDPILAEFGVQWPRVEPSGNSFAPDTSEPAAFSFRLRAFFGVGTRAEIVRFLITTHGGSVTAQRIAEVTAYAKRNVHETLTALAEAGPLVVERRGNELVYYLHPAGWGDVLDLSYEDPSILVPEFLDWTALARTVVPLVVWLEESAELSPYLAASGARELVERIESDLALVGVSAAAGRRSKGEAYWPAFVSIVDGLLAQLDP
jgi:hypothetical protein